MALQMVLKTEPMQNSQGVDGLYGEAHQGRQGI